jgi:hypothetical protein
MQNQGRCWQQQGLKEGTDTPLDPNRAALKSFVDGEDSTFTPNDFFSRWRAQLGVRYTF